MQIVLDGQFDVELGKVPGNPMIPEGAVMFTFIDKETKIKFTCAIPTLQASQISRRISELCSGGNGHYQAEPVYGESDTPEEITGDVIADEG